jgi:predicted ATPase with chaperone activity
LRVARTLADLSERAQPGETDMATATMWRRFSSLTAAS